MVFHNEKDYAAFERLMLDACEKLPMRILGYVLMPNHFHLVVCPHEDGDLSRWLQWLMTSHVRRHHRAHESAGHIWQGRFKAFPISTDSYLLTALRYVERNPVRARLVKAAEDWRWSSLHWRSRQPSSSLLAEPPIELGSIARWTRLVNEPLTAAELESLRTCVNRGSPYGRKNWILRTARELGLQSTLNPRGRPWHKEQGK